MENDGVDPFLSRHGALGALVDEYDRATELLVADIEDLSPEAFSETLDAESPDPDCRSVQTILTHCVRAGFGYLDVARAILDGLESRDDAPRTDPPTPPPPGPPGAAAAAIEQLRSVVRETDRALAPYRSSPDAILDATTRTASGREVDLEGLLEHAIVHLLRHRRQIRRLRARRHERPSR